jgi:ATP-dependent Clp protease ATP-binding subunit ClpC
MFEKYTEKARRTVFFARYEASQFGSPYIETEHLLLGLLREDQALNNRFLRSHSAVASIREDIERHSVIRENIPTSADLPLSTGCRNVLNHAARESERLSHNHIGTEHLLLGILNEEKSFAAELLLSRGVTLAHVRESVAQDKSSPVSPVAQPAGGKPVLSEFGNDLAEQATDERFRPLVGREKELQRLVQILCRLARNNVVLVGEPGVGKKAIIYELAGRIGGRDVPPMLQGKTVLALDLPVIATGVRSRAKFEEALQNIVDDLMYSGGETILFIDHLNTLVRDASDSSSLHFINVIKPALQTGAVRCISTATPENYQQIIRKEPWLEQMFHVVEVAEPNETEAIAILRGTRERYERYHGVTYTDEALQYAVYHSRSYMLHRFLPDKALDLLDEAGSWIKLRQSLPEEIVEARKSVKSAQAREDAAIMNHEFEKARFYSDEARTEREKLNQLYEKHKIPQILPVTREDIEAVVASWTGLSIEAIRKSRMAS